MAASKNPRVCAIVLNYFGYEQTQACLDSLLAEPLAHLYLVDNSADSEEEGRLRAFLSEERFRALGFPIELVVNKRNLGFGRAVNAVVRTDGAECRSSYYLLINNDAKVRPGLVSSLLRAAEEDPRRALVSPRIRWGGDDITYFWYQPILSHISRRAFPGSFPYLSGCCLLVDGALACDRDLFDDDFFMYGEDVELTYRARQSGRTTYCVEDPFAFHEGTGSSRHGGLFYEYHVARGHVLLARKLARSLGERALMQLGRAVYLGARAVVRSIRFRSPVPLRAFVLAFVGARVRPSNDQRNAVASRASRPVTRL